MFKKYLLPRTAVCAAAVLFLGSFIPASQADPVKLAVPVIATGDGLLDACGALGRVSGLDPAGDNFLAVRSGPDGKQQEIDRLSSGAEVTICDEQGSWLGVVYPQKGSAMDCGIDALPTGQAPYAGPCRSGWVHQTFVEVVAG